jgi:hypothetical protein
MIFKSCIFAFQVARMAGDWEAGDAPGARKCSGSAARVTGKPADAFVRQQFERV